MRRLGGFLILFSVAGYVLADDCGSSGITSDIVQCQMADYQKADASLTIAYKHAMASAKQFDDTGALAKKLRNAQRAWIKFRDADCEAQRTVFDGGTMASVVVNGCMISHVKQRTKDLDGFAESML